MLDQNKLITSLNNNKQIGITSTVPLEIIFAAGLSPVDINNIFIESEDPESLVTQSESAGFSSNICAWIKGIYSTVINHGIRRVVAVTGGDCSNTIALAEIMSLKGAEVVPFDYPSSQDRDSVEKKLDVFRKTLSASWGDVKKEKKRLDKIRKKDKKV